MDVVDRPSAAPAPRAWQRTALPLVAFLGVALAVAGALQFLIALVPRDADTAYHVAVGRLIAEHGILHSFPWTSASWLSDHYADKELLFHLLFVPLSGTDWITAAKIVGTLTGATTIFLTYVVLRAERVSVAWLWALLPLVTSSAYLYRFLLVRPHVLSIGLAILAFWAASRRRLPVLAAAAAIYPFAYVAWLLPIGLALLAEAARTLAGERPTWKTLAVASAGTVVGIALHPNAVNLVRFTWLQIGGALVSNAWGGRAGMELGTEFAAFSGDEWVALLLLATAAALVALPLAWRARRSAPVALAFALGAALFGLATVRTARFTEYFVPFSVVALALSTAGFAPARARLAPVAMLVLALLYQGSEEWGLAVRMREWPNRIPSFLARAMQSAIPPEAQVFTCEWGMTGYLMQALPGRRFLVALDPTFFQAKDPELYALWYAATRRPPPDAARLVRERFGARYVACFFDPQFEAFVATLARTPGVRTLLVSDDWTLLDLGPGP
jgi:hypothetical protein